MKLYVANMSPFSQRAKIAIHARGLNVQLLPPPGGTKSADYLAINPMGRLPCLVLDDGVCIPESDTIVEYLEDAFEERPLRPRSPEAAARARLLARVGEIYVGQPMGRLFGQFNPENRDAAVIEAAFAELDRGLEHLNVFLSGERFAVGNELTIADCQLAPMLFYVPMMAQGFGKPGLLDRHAKVAAYMESVKTHPSVAAAYAEMTEAVETFRRTGTPS